jgi:hypothetical protein
LFSVLLSGGGEEVGGSKCMMRNMSRRGREMEGKAKRDYIE